MSLSRIRWNPGILAIFVFLALAAMSVAEEDSSLTESEIESQAAKAAFESMAKQSAKITEELEHAQSTIAALQKSLALATEEREVFQRQAQELKRLLEVFGVNGADGLKKKLIDAVGDLTVTVKERNEFQQALIELYETILNYQKVTVTTDADARMALEDKMRRAARALDIPPPDAVEAPAVPASLTDAMVISYKEELNLVVANVGSKQGVKTAMPFQVIRGDIVVGTVRVVDVREKIAGAVIQDLNSDKERIRVGDRLRVAAVK